MMPPVSPLNPPEGELKGVDVGMDNSIDTSLFQAGVKDQSGNNICQWKYDGFGRVKASSDADMGYTCSEYNVFGDLAVSTDSLGRETEFTYDSLGRITQKHLPGTEGNVIYTYDANAQSENPLGGLVKLDDPSQVKIFSYDKMGRIDKETRTIKNSNGNFITSFEYDLLNRKHTINYPADPNTGSSLTAKYSFSSMGTTSVDIFNSKGRKEIISTILYNEFGQMSEISRGNGTETYYTYDIKGRLSQLVTHTTSNNQIRKLQDVSYTFKIDNSILSMINTPDIDTAGGYLSTVKYDYKYDGLNRLIKAEGLFTKGNLPNSQTQDVIRRFEESYAYSANGNMTGKSIFDPQSHAIQDQLVYSYNEDNHAVTGISSVITSEEKFTMQYDAVGNMISQSRPLTLPQGDYPTSKAMAYDSYNRIIRVTNSTTSETVGQYWYDDQGFRVRKVAKRHISGEDRQVEVLYPSMYFGLEKHKTMQGADIPNTTYSVNNIYLDGVRIAAVIPSGDARYYLTDQVDSVKVVADDDGRAVTRMEYMPYGETWFEEGDTNNAPKYNSQELDRESNFYYYNARHYSQEVARFVTADSVIDDEMDTQGWNRYAYCKGNPIEYKDPTGHAIVETGELNKQLTYETGEYIKSAVKTVAKDIAGAVKTLTGCWTGETGKAVIESAINTVKDIKSKGGVSNYVKDKANEFVIQLKEKPGETLGEVTAKVGEAALLKNALSGKAIVPAVESNINTLPSTLRQIRPGKKFLRYESGHPLYSKVTAEGALKPGTFTASANEGVLTKSELVSRYNLPDKNIPRNKYFEVKPPAGTWVEGPKPVMGGSGSEAVFPHGTPSGSVSKAKLIPE